MFWLVSIEQSSNLRHCLHTCLWCLVFFALCSPLRFLFLFLLINVCVCVWGVCFSFFINKQEQPLAVPKPGSALYCALHTDTHTHTFPRKAERARQTAAEMSKSGEASRQLGGQPFEVRCAFKTATATPTDTYPPSLTHTHIRIDVASGRTRESRQGQWQWRKPSSCIRLTYAFALFFYSYTA